MAVVLIAGGTGLVGQRLSALLAERNYEVWHLSRRADPQARYPAFAWDPAKGEVDAAALAKADYIINLAGAGIADARWTPERRRLIVDSRVQGASLLARYFAEHPDVRPKAYVAASASGYYGDRGAEWLDEGAAAGQGFLAETCQQWEAASQQVRALGIRTPILRIGIVLSTRGGALEKMLLPFRLLVGNYFGSGAQYYPWVHIDDLCRLFIWAMETPAADGFYNAAAPAPATNKTLAQAIKQALGLPALIVPVPEAALRLAMGDMADVVMVSARAVPQRAQAEGFRFGHPDLVAALRDLLRHKH